MQQQLIASLDVPFERAPPRTCIDLGARELVGTSRVMVLLGERIRTVAQSDASTLILGDTGTGKELVARALHEASNRSCRPFVAISCAAFPESLIEVELFGHERGAFTGATGSRAGCFRSADSGTLFLDEIGELALPLQAKLLRVVQERSVQPLGSDLTTAVDVRLICATNRCLRTMIGEGTFREDLYYRLNVLDIDVPPLSARGSDLAELVGSFLGRYARRGQPAGLTPRAWEALLEHDFPGNVRELEHAVQHAIIMAKGEPIDIHHLPRDIRAVRHGCTSAAPTLAQPSLHDALRAFERHYIVQALCAARGKRGAAARRLGISRKTLWAKAKAHRITPADIGDPESKPPPTRD